MTTQVEKIEYHFTSTGKIGFTSKEVFSGIGIKKCSVRPCGGTGYIATVRAFEKIQQTYQTTMRRYDN